jgi:hypothetical protein
MHKSLKYSVPLLLAFLAFECTSQNEKWVKSPGIEISVFKEYENGKPYLTVLYENFGDDTVEKIRYQLINETRGHFDTVLKEIDPPVLLRPKDRHSVPRHIGEDTVSAEYVHVGQVWVVKSGG